MRRFAAWVAVGLVAVAFGSARPAQAGKDLDNVRIRGALACGLGTGLPGFEFLDSQGNWRGLAVDVCRAAAVALFGDIGKVKYVPTNAQHRFTVLQAGEVDMLLGNATQTLVRDTALGLDFTGIYYYGGQGFMVPKKLGVKSARELGGASICVTAGTTTELNLADYFRANKMDLKPVTLEKYEEVTGAYLSGRCDAMTSDVSQLAAIRANDAPNPEDHVILPEVISKEPLGPAVRQGDDQWFDLVKWALYAMIEAEERGITAATVDAALKSEDPNVKRLLGVTPGMGAALGVGETWAFNIIKQVGNYGESFERNVGMGSKLKLARGLNALWTAGGLMYAPPIR